MNREGARAGALGRKQLEREQERRRVEQWLGSLVMQGQWQVFSFCTFTVIHLMLAPMFRPMFPCHPMP